MKFLSLTMASSSLRDELTGSEAQCVEMIGSLKEHWTLAEI